MPTIESMRGKCDTKVVTHVPWDVCADLDRRAHELGCSRADLLRDLVVLGMYGRDAVLSMYAHRLDRLTTAGSTEDQK
ncbi:MAG: hypothetical protein J0H00_19730 [Burkholderiales bacterium]|nr:hypothetical protein [Burkholderiales bacterium]